MKCPKCNNEIEDGSAFCTFCGSPIEKVEPVAQQEVAQPAQEVEQPVQEETVTETPVTTQPVAEEKEVAQNVVNNNEEVNKTVTSNVTKTTVAPEGKKAPAGRHSLITIILAAVAFVVVIAVILTVVLCSKSSEQLFKDAVKSAISEMYTGKAATADSANVSASVELLTDNEDIEEYVDGLKFDANVQYDLKEKQVVFGLNAAQGKDSYLAAKVMADLVNYDVYLQEDNIYDKIVKLELPDEAKDQIEEVIPADEDLTVDKAANKKVAKIITKTINDNLTKDLFNREKVTVNIVGKDKKVKDNTMTMSIGKLQEIVGNVAKTLKMDNEFLSLYKDRDAVVEALDMLEQFADEEDMEGEVVIHLYTSGMSNKFVGLAAVLKSEEGYDIIGEVINTKKNVYEINLKMASGTREETVGTATITVNKSTKDTFDATFSADVEDFGNITVNYVTTQKYNKGIEPLDTASAVNSEDLSEEDLEEIMENLENSKLYEVLSQFTSIDDYIDDSPVSSEEDDMTSTAKKLPAGVKIADNQHFVFNYDDKCIVYNVPKGFEAYADDDEYVLYSYDTDDAYCNVNVVAYWNIDDIPEEIQGEYDYYLEDGAEYYKEAKLSDPEKITVGDYTFTKQTITAIDTNDYVSVQEYYYTELPNGRAYLVEVDNEDNTITESQIKEFLTIEVH